MYGLVGYSGSTRVLSSGGSREAFWSACPCCGAVDRRMFWFLRCGTAAREQLQQWIVAEHQQCGCNNTSGNNTRCDFGADDRKG